MTFPLSETVLKHVSDLKETLAATPNGLALASNQILAEGWSVFVVRPGNGLPEVVINPTWRRGPPEARAMEEGCLSIPELDLVHFNVMRYPQVWLAWDEDEMKPSGTDLVGLPAQIVQHECDHLDGKLVYDYLPKQLQLSVRRVAINNRKAGR